MSVGGELMPQGIRCPSCGSDKGYVAGTGRRPVVRPFTLSNGQWGIGWDVKLDIGAKALHFRGLYQGNA